MVYLTSFGIPGITVSRDLTLSQQQQQQHFSCHVHMEMAHLEEQIGTMLLAG